MKVSVNQETCIGCSLCVSLCDTVFTINNNGTAEPMMTIIEDSLLTDVQEVVNCCPVEAICIEA